MRLTDKDREIISKFIDPSSFIVEYIYKCGYLEALKEELTNESMENEYQRAGVDIKKASKVINRESEIL